MLSAAGISTRQRVVETISASKTWVAPTTTAVIDTASGSGAYGSDGGTTTNYMYTERVYTNHVRRSDGGIDVTNDGYYSHSGFPPADYDEGYVTTPSDPVYDGYRTFHSFVDSSTQTTTPTTSGQATTAFGQTFPGSYGSAVPPVTTFNNLSITPGASYPINVPSGGSLTLIYYK